MKRETLPIDWKKVNRACKSFQHMARHPKPNDECTSWAKCKGHWYIYTEDAKWLQKREG